jgi:hypothetical protein
MQEGKACEDTQGEWHVKMDSWSDTARSQVMPKITAKIRARKSQGRVSLQVSEESCPY